MPIARRVHAREARCEGVDRLEDPLALGHAQRAAGQKVVLHVDDDERVVGLDVVCH